MAAGLGFKTFTTGEVLTAADVNGYLMQGINVFASSAARAAAITSPQEGQYSFLKDTNALEYYDGAAWVGAPVGDITAVNAGTGISGGGASGAVTITNSMATEITASGDIIVGTGSGTFDNLPIGTTGQILTADTTVSPYKVKWASPASAGGMTLLSTTSLSGATTNITGISTSYVNLFVSVIGLGVSSNAQITVKPNGSAAIGFQSTTKSNSGTLDLVSGGITRIFSTDTIPSGFTLGNSNFTIFDYASSNRHPFSGASMAYAGAYVGYMFGGGLETASAITSIEFGTTAGTFNAGTVKIYGVN